MRKKRRKRVRRSERQVHHGDTPSIILWREREREEGGREERKRDESNRRTSEREKDRRT